MSVYTKFFPTSATFLAVDDNVFLASRNLKVGLETPRRHEANPLLRAGPAGAPDQHGTELGTVIEDGGLFKMWYSGHGHDRRDLGLYKDATTFEGIRVCYAESRDGLQWNRVNVKTPYNVGDKPDNAIFPGYASVIKEAKASPDERYQMMFYYGDRQRPDGAYFATSPDGLHWQSDFKRRVDDYMEFWQWFRFKGRYFVTGQQFEPLTKPIYSRRVMPIYVSDDKERWERAPRWGFEIPIDDPEKTGMSEQVHLGVGVITYDNVVVGLYGRFHSYGKPEIDHVDLGLIVSNDGINWREPEPGRIFLEKGKPGDWDSYFLVQANAILRVGDEMRIYYTGSPYGNGLPDGVEFSQYSIGLAVLPADRFGAFELVDTHERGECVSALILPRTKDEVLRANAAVPKGACLRCEIKGHGYDPVPGYTLEESIPIEGDGVSIPVRWGKNRDLSGLPDSIFLPKEHPHYTGRRKSIETDGQEGRAGFRVRWVLEAPDGKSPKVFGFSFGKA